MSHIDPAVDPADVTEISVVPASTPQPAAFDPERPLGNLAISLSGGGYRAAAFHLGTLALLERAKLLNSVVGLSTVSGGTICGMAWVVSMIEGRTFGDFHAKFGDYLKNTNVIGEALECLTGDRAEDRHEWASLIASAADVYARPDLYGPRTFGDVLDAPLQLEEAIFNTTEFHTGLDFRFWRSNDPKAVLGNFNYPLPREVARHVRIADVVAGSSCFPGGFEPFVFPQHFHWGPSFPLKKALDGLGRKFGDGLPLMDGGVYDNQGVESLVEAFDKSSATTIIISDVSARNDRMYTPPAPPESRGFLTLNGVFWIGRLLFVLALAAGIVIFINGWDAARNGDWRWQDYLLYLVPGILSFAVAAALFWLRRRLGEVNRMLEKTVEIQAWPSFRKLTVPEFTQMLVLRVTSLLALTSSVFMARIRRLVFRGVYEDKEFQGKRISNLIYAMAKAKQEPDRYRNFPWLMPSTALQDLSTAAEAMPTTLWFTDASQFTTLERAGGATACFVLLRYIVEQRPGEWEEGKPLHDVYLRLRGEWDDFQKTTPAPAPTRSEPGTVSLWGAS